jgi:uncharacterized protein YuzE
MKIEYNHKSDLLYIQLTDKPHGKTRQITETFILDFDEDGNVRGIEILDARRFGIEPLSLNIEQYALGHDASPLSEEENRLFEAELEQRTQKTTKG